ncbi:hypothetical protein B0F87_105216 [Methylobacter tundripaludum]|jgi:hypothetical protein|uniref:Uncharacterized protein n=1 Tax=Methylobacter tundripaludum TaxID=173365 RepID=A0A2S6HE21_9GAMM|nr:hypothetical protein B0F87_105216 [Methylobacter tundripaludum]
MFNRLPNKAKNKNVRGGAHEVINHAHRLHGEHQHVTASIDVLSKLPPETPYAEAEEDYAQ